MRPAVDLHSERPSAYFDQWVWIRLAKASVGAPLHAGDADVLTAVRAASRAGVAFPLSSTHYIETSRIKDPRQRRDLAQVMAPVSRLLNLRSQRSLLRMQMLNAMHESFERPYFRPAVESPLGLGVAWTMLGRTDIPKIMTGDREVTDAELPNRLTLVRAMAQLGETLMLAGPADDEIDDLRKHGYRPDQVEVSTQSRLEWETSYTDVLKQYPADRDELRVRLMARELIHEHFALFTELMQEYRLDLARLLAADPAHPGSMRADMMRFSDRIPSMRIAADMKVELFRNSQRAWSVNMMHDIDAISLAVPYCHLVVVDNDAADLLRRTKAHSRHRTMLLSKFTDIPDALNRLVPLAAGLADKSGWNSVGPPAPFCSRWVDLPSSSDVQTASIGSE